eukprot:CAMPEP_0184312790 /NCGR_PEP_ID=MMETSP1049-20130417/54042_1 /TAXON_ID=77928 /ORGANISM="Proteomonas sulcata, Strain CCMP704" /LENGTH=62 /DNA_ID=CAMNT_0026629295 /DNA_START=115 /DNA_END=301 /DNA_ORIENTATION=+
MELGWDQDQRSGGFSAGNKVRESGWESGLGRWEDWGSGLAESALGEDGSLDLGTGSKEERIQ